MPSKAQDWFDKVMAERGNYDGSTIIIQSRVHTADMTGHIISNKKSVKKLRKNWGGIIIVDDPHVR